MCVKKKLKKALVLGPLPKKYGFSTKIVGLSTNSNPETARSYTQLLNILIGKFQFFESILKVINCS
jgi:hypothetical protein